MFNFRLKASVGEVFTLLHLFFGVEWPHVKPIGDEESAITSLKSLFQGLRLVKIGADNLTSFSFQGFSLFWVNIPSEGSDLYIGLE